MYYILTFLICGISFAPLIIKKPDIWHAQGIFVQACLLVAFSWSFFENKNKVLVKNYPLGILNLWIGGHIAYICWLGQKIGIYDVKHFFPYFNFQSVHFNRVTKRTIQQMRGNSLFCHFSN